MSSISHTLAKREMSFNVSVACSYLHQRKLTSRAHAEVMVVTVNDVICACVHTYVHTGQVAIYVRISIKQICKNSVGWISV